MKEVLIAFAVGIGVGVLIAPDKGSETIKKIKDQFDDILDNASEKGKDLYNDGKRFVKETKSKVTGAADDVQNAGKRFE